MLAVGDDKSTSHRMLIVNSTKLYRNDRQWKKKMNPQFKLIAAARLVQQLALTTFHKSRLDSDSDESADD
jgi:hypothetical protein